MPFTTSNLRPFKKLVSKNIQEYVQEAKTFK